MITQEMIAIEANKQCEGIERNIGFRQGALWMLSQSSGMRWVRDGSFPGKVGKYKCELKDGRTETMWFRDDKYPIKWIYLDMNNAGPSDNCVLHNTDVVAWLNEEASESAELSRLRSALTEIANMRGSDQLHRCWDIAIKALNQ